MACRISVCSKRLPFAAEDVFLPQSRRRDGRQEDEVRPALDQSKVARFIAA